MAEKPVRIRAAAKNPSCSLGNFPTIYNVNILTMKMATEANTMAADERAVRSVASVVISAGRA